MSKSLNIATKNVLETQQESASENEESDTCTTDQSSSASENTLQQPKDGKLSSTSQTTKSSSNSATSATSNSVRTITATQFSVQRSDTDGLRMRISAIRPVNKGSANSNNLEINKKETKTTPAAITITTTKVPLKQDQVNNNTIETLKVKIGSKAQEKQQKQKQEEPSKKRTALSATGSDLVHSRKMSVDVVAGVASDGTAGNKSNTNANAAATSTSTAVGTTCSSMHAITASTLSHLAQAHACLSDATESGLSEATTTTVATRSGGVRHGKAAKKKIKRKKVQSKTVDAKKTQKKSNPNAAFSSDSDEDNQPLLHMQKPPQLQPHLQLQQRAPRLLLTAINSKTCVPQIKPLNSLLTAALTASIHHGSGDNMGGISSSDNELPDLVSAAIKRVESDTDDTGDTTGFRKAKNKNLPQYQSTLLQDFMEKTQMLGQTSTATTAVLPNTPAAVASPKISTRADHLLANLNSNSQSDSIASSSGTVKRRRGRPKKVLPAPVVAIETDAIEASANSGAVMVSINESADSGVISTTSTTQSTSPLHKMSATRTASPVGTAQKGRKAEATEALTSPAKSIAESACSSKPPKIDMAYLDKRMYAATERVLYPPPRNKRRQSIGAPVASTSTQKACQQLDRKSTATKATKEELQLDPVWRKIDVNKKFRRPSVSGYKSDGGGVGGGNTTICSKILAAKSGYVSDYGSFHARSHHHHHHHGTSGYKSDASGKSRYSTKSCASRRSRAKSCGYRSDCKESGATLKSTKFRRKRRSTAANLIKATGNLNDEQDILQLAGLSLGQSSEESNEYVCKPSLESLPTTSVSKKYGEINRFITTGEYFGRGSGVNSFASLHANLDASSQDGFGMGSSSFNRKLLLQRKSSLVDHELLPHSTSRKIKSRRSSVASYCSSYYSGTTTMKLKRHRRRKSFRFPASSKSSTVDSKLLTEIDIITSTFGALCRIQNGAGTENRATSSSKEKLLSEANKLQAATSSSSSKRESRDKRTSLKKRKMSENLDFALLSAAGASALSLAAPSGGSGSSTKRRHKKASSSSPDDHKLPLKKRHYLLTPGDKSSEAAVAVAAKLFASNAEAWAAAAAAAKSTASVKSQQQFGAKAAKAALTPKKRHLLQTPDETPSVKISNSSPLRIVVDTATTAAMAAASSAHSAGASSSGSNKLLDISPISVGGKQQQNNEVVHKKRTRLEGLVSKIAHTHTTDEQQVKEKDKEKHNKTSTPAPPQIDSETSCPPPGVFEPSVELEIQIPPIAKLNESSSIITKSEVDSPLLLDLNKSFAANSAPAATTTPTKVEGQRVVETLLNKTGGNLILKRKRKKFNRTGFPTVRRKKRKINEHLLLDVTPDITEQVQKVTAAAAGRTRASTPATNAVLCDRVPHAGEASDTFLERANRTPRVSVVALERLQSAPNPATSTPTSSKEGKSVGKQRVGRKPKAAKVVTPSPSPAASTEKLVPKKMKLARTESIVVDQKDVPNTSKANHKKPKLSHSENASSQQRETAVINPVRIGRGRKLKECQPTAVSVEKATSNVAVKHEAVAVKTPTVAIKAATAASKIPTAAAKKQEICTAPPPKIPVRKPASSETPQFSKSTVQKIITAKSLEAKVKLPAGIDPNTNFSCKIRLKRRSSFHPLMMTNKPLQPPPPPRPAPPTTEEIAAEAAQKDAEKEQPEHDVLPLSDALNVADSEAASDTGDEKLTRKVARLKKNYLPAGLFSDYFKLSTELGQKTVLPSKKSTIADKKDASTASGSTNLDAMLLLANSNLGTLRLPPPPYCEKYFRRSQVDFQLPYDIWWAYTNSKLPMRITVPSWNYRKIRTNIYAESVRPNNAGIDHPTCNCKSDNGCGDNCLNRMVYTECSPSSCPTREKCRNQKIQRHEVAPGVERFMTENKGWGVRTKLPIIKGTYILEYVGEVVTEREFKDRMGTLYLNDTHHYCLHLDGGLVIDGHRMGSDGRFVNHSCQPNCEMQKWSVNGLSRMALFAKRNIEDGEELTYDYNFSLFNPSEGQPCRCNTPQCRGVIGGKSQRIKPLPVESKPVENPQKDPRNGRQRKRKARKNTARLQSKDIVVARVQQLSEKEKKLVKQHNIFLVRTFEKIRRCKAKRNPNSSETKPASPSSPHPPASPTSASTPPPAISQRRPSTPSSLAAQISAFCSPRNIKTRGLTLAVQDPEVEKMAKIAVILRDICSALETLKDSSGDKVSLISLALTAANGSAVNHKKKKALKLVAQKKEAMHLKTVQTNIEQGYYKQPAEFDADMQKIFADARQAHQGDELKLKALQTLVAAFEAKKRENHEQLLQLVGGDEQALKGFQNKSSKGKPKSGDSKQKVKSNAKTLPKATLESDMPSEDIIRCICGLHKDEGLMIQCASCMVWQHTECTKADVKADNYHCEQCDQRQVDREIPLEDFTEEGHRYYLTLMRGDLHVRQGDAVYVLRDIPVKDADGKVVPKKKHTYETIGDIDYNECDIFRVERLWKDGTGKRFIFGHHFLRPHETFHEPSRRFYPNEVVRVPLYEVVPIELVIGRCWVLDRTTFCKGRPIECTQEEHCYICELRVNKSAHFFSKAKISYPICTKSYAFRKFPEKLKISKTYAPHDVDPSLLKSKKQKTDNEAASTNVNSVAATNVATVASKQEVKKRQGSNSPATVHLLPRVMPTVQMIKQKRSHLENVLKTIKLKRKNTQIAAASISTSASSAANSTRPPIDLSYLLTGRGARHRKTLATAAAGAASAVASVPV